MLDLHNNIAPAQTIAAASASGGLTGSGVDLAGFDKADVQINVGAGSNDGDYSVSVEESSDNSTWSTVASGDLQGSFTSNIDTGSDLMEHVGYHGNTRYIRVTVTENTAATTAPTVAALLQRAHARTRPA